MRRISILRRSRFVAFVSKMGGPRDPMSSDIATFSFMSISGFIEFDCDEESASTLLIRSILRYMRGFSAWPKTSQMN